MIYLIFERIDIKPEAKREKRRERRKIIHRATLAIIPPICTHRLPPYVTYRLKILVRYL
jgi:hypothetical protein